MSAKLIPQFKALWLQKLRSGEYEQTTGRLRDDHGYCCLGVAFEAAIELRLVPHLHWDGDVASTDLDPQEGSLPDEVALAIFGMDCDCRPINDPSVEIYGKSTALATLNDDGWNFLDIAGLIEDQL